MSNYWKRMIGNIELLNDVEKKEFARSVRPAPTTVEQAISFATADIDDLFDGGFAACVDTVRNWKEFDQILERLVLECHELFSAKEQNVNKPH